MATCITIFCNQNVLFIWSVRIVLFRKALFNNVILINIKFKNDPCKEKNPKD